MPLTAWRDSSRPKTAKTDCQPPRRTRPGLEICPRLRECSTGKWCSTNVSQPKLPFPSLLETDNVSNASSAMSPPLYLNWQNGECGGAAEENGWTDRKQRRKEGRRGDVAICNETTIRHACPALVRFRPPRRTTYPFCTVLDSAYSGLADRVS